VIALLLAVSLALSRTQAGQVHQLPKDTLIVDGQRTVVVAIPEDVVSTPEDLNYDGRVSWVTFIPWNGVR
jgi:hypothetical protein